MQRLLIAFERLDIRANILHRNYSAVSHRREQDGVGLTSLFASAFFLGPLRLVLLDHLHPPVDFFGISARITLASLVSTWRMPVGKMSSATSFESDTGRARQQQYRQHNRYPNGRTAWPFGLGGGG